MDYPSGSAETTIGNVDWAWTEAAHVHIGTSDGSYTTVRGVQYHVGLHLFLIDGQWRTRNLHDLYVSRPIVDRSYNKPVSEAARKTIEQILRAWWLGFVSVNEKLGVKAERAHRKDEVDRLEEDIIQLQSQLDDKVTLHRLAIEKLEALGG